MDLAEGGLRNARRLFSTLWYCIAEYELNIEEQAEWYVKKHPHLACFDEPM